MSNDTNLLSAASFSIRKSDNTFIRNLYDRLQYFRQHRKVVKQATAFTEISVITCPSIALIRTKQVDIGAVHRCGNNLFLIDYSADLGSCLTSRNRSSDRENA